MDPTSTAPADAAAPTAPPVPVDGNPRPPALVAPAAAAAAVGTGPAPLLACCCIVRDAGTAAVGPTGPTIDALLASILEPECVFDEIVLVDTGSVDDTKERILKALTARCYQTHPEIVWPAAGEVPVEFRILDRDVGAHPAMRTRAVRVVLASFAWVDDFAAARQVSFDLATARWRMYLDADDVFPDGYAKNLPDLLLKTEAGHAESNCVSLQYEYVPEEMLQDVIRIYRWEEGWRWKGRLHEKPMRTGANRERVISKYENVVVRHRPPADQGGRSARRNIGIVEKAYNEATTATEKGEWAYYLATYAAEVHNVDLARKFFAEAAAALGLTNLGNNALVLWSRMELALGHTERAIDLAAQAIGRAPERPDGHAALGMAYDKLGAPYRAAIAFDLLAKLPPQALESMQDVVFVQGLANAAAAHAYYQIGRTADAEAALVRIPRALDKRKDIRAAAVPVRTALMKTEGYKRLLEFWEYLIWDTEPIKALELLERLVPAAIADMPQVQQLRRRTLRQLPHLANWDAYRRAYAAIPEYPYHVPPEDRAWTLRQARARGVINWAKALPADGPPLHVLTIGVQDGIIEGAMMEQCARLHLTVCDVAPQASRGIAQLQGRFPGRVTAHAVVHNHYDWFPPTPALFDAVLLFEVLEHLPNDRQALREINQRLREGGKLFLSTPIAAEWVEGYLTEPAHAARPWWHVRAHNPTSLWRLLRMVGFTGSLVGVGEESLFFGALEAMPHVRPVAANGRYISGEDVAILAPAMTGVNGFDPLSIKEGHVGGSEEAVIHLSAALARAGARVTVFAPLPHREDPVFVWRGVRWRPPSEFDVESLEGALLVWRAPVVAAQLKRQNPRLRVLNWLHDAAYTADDGRAVPYDGADGTIVLSKFHARSVATRDRYDGALLLARNGIVPEEFPLLDDGNPQGGVVRDPQRCIYASAPNRGLDLLLTIWPQVRAAVPEATLRIFYDWEPARRMMKANPALEKELGPVLAYCEAKIAELKDQGVEFVGGVSHARLNTEYRTAGVWAYPPYNFEETHCISALRAQASGCWPVVVPTGALAETCRHGYQVPLSIGGRDGTGQAGDDLDLEHLQARYAAALIRSLKNPPPDEERRAMRAWALTQSWDAAAQDFLTYAITPNRRITLFAGAFGRRFDGLGSADGLPMGGSEEAVITLAGALNDCGEEVVVYCPLPEGGARDDGTGVRWLDAATFVPEGPHGTLIAWRCPTWLPRLKGHGYPVLLWLMDPEYRNTGAQPWDYALADRIVVLTSAHAQIVARRDGWGAQVLPPITLVHNGLPEVLTFMGADGDGVPREPHRVMWATSVDRGLAQLLAQWPQVRAAVPDATLHVYYGVEPLERAASTMLKEAAALRAGDQAALKALVNHAGALEDLTALAMEVASTPAELAAAALEEQANERRQAAAALRAAMAALAPMGVVYHGGVPEQALYDGYLRASVFAFPCVGFEETFSIATVKAMALGAWPLVRGGGALAEVVAQVLGAPGERPSAPAQLALESAAALQPTDAPGYIASLVTLLKSPPGAPERWAMMAKARVLFSTHAMGTKMMDAVTKARAATGWAR